MNLLASIPSPDISFIQLGPFRVHFYALFILSGIVVAIALTSSRLSRRGGQPGLVLDIALWTVPLGIVGGRLYHVVTHPNDYFFAGADLWKILYVWEGGLAIFGAVLFGSVGAYIACQRSGLRFLSFADALALGMLLAQAPVVAGPAASPPAARSEDQRWSRRGCSVAPTRPLRFPPGCVR
ncbi:prolipoprotein diacylglyceryl transferase family protein [Cryobacterium sp. TMS1-13-1]|uniref:prolipoprotein diacylglyceryl transferase family protein n=1 Tax=Cryobacterium sp. TMS1-13-1 TaxID=1259220 RepID=UPI00106D33BD|nr:prolipoprotein diacylglyceryl transferase family protein [Cryobacterium sp. TMS1-13-1]TFD21502.1 hypothetical protein E3T31_11965 [Cryobacterium sp. TMS1-13-1]